LVTGFWKYVFLHARVFSSLVLTSFNLGPCLYSNFGLGSKLTSSYSCYKGWYMSMLFFALFLKNSKHKCIIDGASWQYWIIERNKHLQFIVTYHLIFLGWN
jgi:hypothetical protein